MDTLKCIKTRRSYRKFLDKPVEEEKIMEIITAGNYAPTGKNQQLTHFIVITNNKVRKELITKVNEVLIKLDSNQEGYESLINPINLAKQGKYIFNYNAPLFIIIAHKKNNANAMADSVCAIENMMLAANDLGLGSCYVNQLRYLNNNPEMLTYLKELGLEEDETVYCSLSVGYVEKMNDIIPERNNKVTYIK